MADHGSAPKRAQTLLSGGKLEQSSVRSNGETASTGALPKPGKVVGDKYRIDEPIAQGGMGAVYAATHIVSGKRVALKWMLPTLGLMPGATDRFVREARATARIDHPNVVDIYDVGTDEGSVYLVMELLRGETLHQRLTRAPVTPRTAIALLMPALRGVAAAHAGGVIHRDLKPDNIFLCQSSDGEPRDLKVLDFGISKIAKGDELRDGALTHSGMVMGTPYYMSPEQVRGANQVDERSDVYAFGVILYEMLTSRRPFEAETYNQLIFKIATEDPVPIGSLNAHVEPSLVAVVERAMARDPAARFASVAELALALEPHSGGATFRLASAIPGELEPARMTEPSARTASASPARKGKALLLIGVAAALVVLGIALWRARQDDPSARAGKTSEIDGLQVAPASAAPPRSQPQLAPTPSTAPAPAALAGTAQAQSVPQPDVPRGREAPPATSRPERRAPHAKRPQRLEPAADGKLPANWDERLRAAPTDPHPGSAPAPSAAGRIDKSDLR
jgi:serine/threonine-protein kinase